MTDIEIRRYFINDIPAMKALWKKTFNDSDEYLEAFFRHLPDTGTGVVALKDGVLAGAAYALTCQALKGCGADEPVIGYVYAVAVEESLRGQGIGTALVEKVIEEAKKRAASVICTLPASEELYSFYERFGLTHSIFRKSIEVPAEDREMTMPLNSTEYMLFRRSMLPEKAVRLYMSEPGFELERELCEAYSGGLYASMSGIAAAYVEDGVCRIHELIAHDEIAARDVAASVAHALGAEKCVFHLPCREGEGERYVLSDTELPDGCIWNFTFD